LYGDSRISTPGLTIPHPSMADRKFVLAPLAEIAARVVHPVSGKDIGTMLEECTDQSEPLPLPYKFLSRSSSQNI
jgi:2-amino-4-hydroxy-6-hydroxymethyldihydropteridine diphosphokinase